MAIAVESLLRQEKLIQSVLNRVRGRNVLQAGERVLVAVSGGLDSTVLLHVLARLQRVLDVSIVACHVDHKTRGAVTTQEGQWVRVLAERLNVPFVSLSVPESGAGRSSAELREMRRALLLGAANSNTCDVIATAHHMDDNAETLLMRCIQGTGVLGMAAMADRSDPWVKPLLAVNRADLENYARAQHLAWAEDPSNARDDYLRNAIRHRVMPVLEELRAGSLGNMARLAERIRDEEAELQTYLRQELPEDLTVMPVGRLEKFPPVLQRRLIQQWLRAMQLVPNPRVVESLIASREAVHEQGVFALRSDTIVFFRDLNFGEEWHEPVSLEFGRKVDLGAHLAWAWVRKVPVESANLARWVVFLVFRPPGMFEDQSTLLEWNALPWPLCIRKPSASELAHGEFRKLMDKSQIPEPLRHNWPVLASSGANNTLVAILGVGVLTAFRPKRSGRCVAIESFFEE